LSLFAIALEKVFAGWACCLGKLTFKWQSTGNSMTILALHVVIYVILGKKQTKMVLPFKLVCWVVFN
jgi:hypothetical protein